MVTCPAELLSSGNRRRTPPLGAQKKHKNRYPDPNAPSSVLCYSTYDLSREMTPFPQHRALKRCRKSELQCPAQSHASLGRKVPLSLATNLLGLDIRRYNGVVDNMRSINCIDRRHPGIVSHCPRLQSTSREIVG